MLHLTVNDLSNLKLEPYNIKYTSYRTNIENETLYFRFSAILMSITQLDKNNRKSCVIEFDNISYSDIDDFFNVVVMIVPSINICSSFVNSHIIL